MRKFWIAFLLLAGCGQPAAPTPPIELVVPSDPIQPQATPPAKLSEVLSAIPNTIAALNAGKSVQLVFAGDSWTSGSGVRSDLSFPGQVAGFLATHYPKATVTQFDAIPPGENQPIENWKAVVVQAGSVGGQQIMVRLSGVSGDTASRALKRLPNFIGPFPGSQEQVQFIFILLGVNDSVITSSAKYAPPALYKVQLKELVGNLVNGCSCDVVLGTPGFYANPSNLTQYSSATKAVAMEGKYPLVDVNNLWVEHWQSGEGEGTWLLPGDLTHPSEIGHTMIADLLEKTLFPKSP